LTLQAKLRMPSQVLLPTTLCAASNVGCQQLLLSVTTNCLNGLWHAFHLLAGLDIQQSQAAATQPCHLSSRCVLHIHTAATAARPAAERFNA
jgi:hypothetical protein